jgi:N6-L-threonylcarbamoyladenine synthase
MRYNRAMKLLGIETSCDETAAAVVEDGRRVLSNVVASQVDIHREYGGVVPEIAARSHIEVILPVIHEALAQGRLSWDDIDGIAVTQGPGLLGSLLIGTLTARTLAMTQGKPLYAVNHVVAHTFANFLIEPEPQFPLLSLSVSGGHSHLLYFKSPLEYRLLGATRDDAAGEAFDKVAKMMGLPYPGGPSVGMAALEGDERAYQLPNQTQINNMASSFQRTVCETLAGTLRRAYDQYAPQSVVIAGGVAANHRLRQEVSRQLPLEMTYAPMEYCTDNGAMIASMGYWLAQAGRTTDPLDLKTDPSLAI